MDFELSEEQQLLKQTCERYFADHYQFESRKRYAHEPRGWSLIAWKQYADLGLLGGGFIQRGGSDAQRAERLPKIAAGELSLSFAHAERQARYDLADVAT